MMQAVAAAPRGPGRRDRVCQSREGRARQIKHRVNRRVIGCSSSSWAPQGRYLIERIPLVDCRETL